MGREFRQEGGGRRPEGAGWTDHRRAPVPPETVDLRVGGRIVKSGAARGVDGGPQARATVGNPPSRDHDEIAGGSCEHRGERIPRIRRLARIVAVAGERYDEAGSIAAAHGCQRSTPVGRASAFSRCGRSIASLAMTRTDT